MRVINKEKEKFKEKVKFNFTMKNNNNNPNNFSLKNNNKIKFIKSIFCNYEKNNKEEKIDKNIKENFK